MALRLTTLLSRAHSSARSLLKNVLSAFSLPPSLPSSLPHSIPPGLNSILFAINIDNSDLNGSGAAATRGPGGGPASSVSHLLKESTQGIGSLWKESTQGVSSLLREIGTVTTSAAAGVVPGFTLRADASDPLPVVPRSASAGRGGGHWGFI